MTCLREVLASNVGRNTDFSVRILPGFLQYLQATTTPSTKAGTVGTTACYVLWVAGTPSADVAEVPHAPAGSVRQRGVPGACQLNSSATKCRQNLSFKFWRYPVFYPVPDISCTGLLYGGVNAARGIKLTVHLQLVRGEGYVEIYLHSPTHLHSVVLNSLNSGTWRCTSVRWDSLPFVRIMFRYVNQSVLCVYSRVNGAVCTTYINMSNIKCNIIIWILVRNNLNLR
jgi:hypothetical protein